MNIGGGSHQLPLELPSLFNGVGLDVHESYRQASLRQCFVDYQTQKRTVVTDAFNAPCKMRETVESLSVTIKSV